MIARDHDNWFTTAAFIPISWGPAVPIEPPASDGRGFKQAQASGRHVEHCSGKHTVTVVLPRDVPDDKANPCLDDGGVELDKVLAIVDGGQLLTFGSPLGFAVTRARTPGTDLDQKAAFALVRQAAGSLLVGDGCCWLERNAVLYGRREGPHKSWDLRGQPPKGETWTGAPLVSPDQRWVVAQSAKTGRVTLWLYHVEPARSVPAPIP